MQERKIRVKSLWFNVSESVVIIGRTFFFTAKPIHLIVFKHAIISWRINFRIICGDSQFTTYIFSSLSSKDFKLNICKTLFGSSKKISRFLCLSQNGQKAQLKNILKQKGNFSAGLVVNSQSRAPIAYLSRFRLFCSLWELPLFGLKNVVRPNTGTTSIHWQDFESFST